MCDKFIRNIALWLSSQMMEEEEEEYHCRYCLGEAKCIENAINGKKFCDRACQTDFYTFELKFNDALKHAKRVRNVKKVTSGRSRPAAILPPAPSSSSSEESSASSSESGSKSKRRSRRKGKTSTAEDYSILRSVPPGERYTSMKLKMTLSDDFRLTIERKNTIVEPIFTRGPHADLIGAESNDPEKKCMLFHSSTRNVDKSKGIILNEADFTEGVKIGFVNLANRHEDVHFLVQKDIRGLLTERDKAILLNDPSKAIYFKLIKTQKQPATPELIMGIQYNVKEKSFYVDTFFLRYQYSVVRYMFE